MGEEGFEPPVFLMYRIYSPAPIHHLSSSPILFYLNMSKTKFVLQIYKQYFNFPNFYEKNLNCGPNENRTRVSSVTSWKDNHYPMRPIFSTPYRIRTCDPQLRRLLLYPTELREHCNSTMQIYKQYFN